MKRTLQPTKKNSSAEIQRLLEDLSRLPIDLSREILYRTDYSRLDAICHSIKTKNESNTQIQRLNYFCLDVNFWRDWLLENDYDLPEDLPQLIQVLRKKGESDLDVLKALFFSNEKELKRRKDLFANELKIFRYSPHAKKRLPTLKEMEQALIDFDYIDRQVTNRRKRTEGKPMITSITLSVPTIEFGLPERSSIEDLLQFLVDNDIALPPLNYLDRSLSKWVKDIWINEKMIIGSDTLVRLAEQYLTVLPFLLQEGDLLEIRLIGEQNNISFFLENSYYFVDANKNLHLFLRINQYEDEDGLIFPKAATSFLVKNGIKTLADLINFYPIMNIFRTVEYFKDGETVPFEETYQEQKARLKGEISDSDEIDSEFEEED